MPYRNIPFVNGQIYHVFNRGVEKRRIFEAVRDYSRFLKTISYYQLMGPKPRFSDFSPSNSFKPVLTKKILKILVFCLMPNHFHLLLKQEQEGAITEFMTKISLSYTKYYNIKYSRVGPLLQGEFKAVLIESEEQLMHVSRYIHLNPTASFLVKNLDNYPWTSYFEYVEELDGLCSKSEVLELFKSAAEYKQFLTDQIDYSQTLEFIKHQILEEY